MAEKKYTKEYLKELQSLPLSEKILLTQARILEYAKHFDNKIYISFSGGKDSTVLLNVARQVLPDVKAVFIDTGLEYPEIREFVKTYDNVVILRPEMNFKEVITTYGYPLLSKEYAKDIDIARRVPDGKIAQKFIEGNDYDKKYPKFSILRWAPLKNSDIPISADCCKIMKKDPAHKYLKETGEYPVIGTLCEESKMRENNWLIAGCNIYKKYKEVSKPLSFWTEQDILEYLVKYNIPYCSIYGDILQDENGKYYLTGCQRTGCVFCLFGAHLEKPENSRLIRLKETHPKLYNYCMKPLEEGGLGMKDVCDKFNELSSKRTHIYY